MGVFHLQKKIRKISIGNFRLGRARSICHKFHSREPREAWPLERPQKVYGTGDKDKKSVNGTQISIGKFPPEKWDYLSRILFILENFQWNEPKSRVPFTSQPEFPEFFGKCKTLQDLTELHNHRSLHVGGLDSTLPLGQLALKLCLPQAIPRLLFYLVGERPA